jgi:hypothetical protein
VRSRHRSVSSVLAAVALLAIVSTAPAAGAAPKAFGGNFNANTDPSNASPAFQCDVDPDPCTWVMNKAFAGSGTNQLTLRAPRDGTIGRIRLLAATSGSFRLFLARTKADGLTSKVVRRGPAIAYTGNGGAGCAPSCTIETFTLNLPVRKGDVLAIRASRASFLRCDSGSPNILLFMPPMAVGNAARVANDTTGCQMLLKAIYK